MWIYNAVPSMVRIGRRCKNIIRKRLVVDEYYRRKGRTIVDSVSSRRSRRVDAVLNIRRTYPPVFPYRLIPCFGSTKLRVGLSATKQHVHGGSVSHTYFDRSQGCLSTAMAMTTSFPSFFPFSFLCRRSSHFTFAKAQKLLRH